MKPEGWAERKHEARAALAVKAGRRALLGGFAVLTAGLAAARLPQGRGPATTVRINDAQCHLLHHMHRETPSAVAPRARRLMDAAGVEAAVVVPQPFTAGWVGYGLTELKALAALHPARFAFCAGGESLNPIIQATPADHVTPQALGRFVAIAEQIAAAGAAGFGELAAEHFSSETQQPYESSPADHPLFLALADVAARHAMPVCLHMEAVPQEMRFPPARPGFRPSARDPAALHENISALERLLEHNPTARIVWLHAGWDLTAERSVALMRGLLARHPNLFMTIKSDHHGVRKNSPFLPGFAIKPGWLALLNTFPDRFAVGSDQFFNDPPERIERARKLIDALPPELALRVGQQNVRHIYRLPMWS